MLNPFSLVRFLALMAVSMMMLAVASPAKAQPGRVFYSEDFSQTKEGHMPAGWSGGQNSMVKADRGRKMLVLFQGYEDSFVVNGLSFPENWQMDFVVRIGEIGVKIANAATKVNYNEVILNQTRVYLDGSLHGKNATVSLRKEGPVYKVLIDGKEAAMGRFPGSSPATSMTIGIHGSGNAPVTIYSIKGTEL